MSIDYSPIPCPVVVPLDAILPEEPLLMMGAGPVPIPAAVAKANTIVINHLGATMAKIIEQVKEMARYVFQTRTKWVLGVAGPGSAAMEMAMSNLAWRGTRVLAIKNGFFSARMAEMATRVGADVSVLEVPDRSVASLEEVAEAIARQPSRRVDADLVLETIIMALPQERYEQTFETFVNWARYGDLFAYDETARTIAAQ